jgi:aldehyde dehydrogenase (NAD+)
VVALKSMVEHTVSQSAEREVVKAQASVAGKLPAIQLKGAAMKTLTTHYIDGAFVESHGREVMDIVRPTDSRIIGRVTLGDEEDARRAIAAARRAFATYGRSRKEERAEIMQRLHEAVAAHIGDLTDAMVEEYGAPVMFCRSMMEAAANVFLSAEKALQELPLTRSWGKTTVTLEPVGVAGLITPWNANSFFLCAKLASAVAAGCTAVIKPSELSSLQTRTWLECLVEAELPKGLCNVVIGRGDVVGAEIVRNSDVAKISFTGSVAVGKSIMRDGAATMKRVTLELGGKSPNILLDDADLDKAIPITLAIAFMNSGQACVAGTRLLAPKSRLDAVKQAIKEAIRAFPAGDPADPNTAVGPMVSQKQYERVQSYIRKGIEEGAELLVGGEGHPRGLEAGYFVKPTVFVNVRNDMTIAREEIFGPVLCVITYDNDEDAIRIANDTNYGLHAYVNASDVRRARRVASQLLAGRVAINGLLDDQQAPFGGFKNSGVGREFGTYGIEAFLEPRAILEA